jgi:hypothetical protein
MHPRHPADLRGLSHGFAAFAGAGGVIKVTKIGVAEAHVRTAARLFFEGGHLVPVYTLASAAREIVGSIAKKIDMETLEQGFAELFGVSDKEMFRPFVWQANFFKHADRDPYANLVFYEESVTWILFVACRDFDFIGAPLPLEARIFVLWSNARVPKISQMPLRRQKFFRHCIRLFPGIRAANFAEQKKIGLAVLQAALTDSGLREKFMSEVLSTL